MFLGNTGNMFLGNPRSPRSMEGTAAPPHSLPRPLLWVGTVHTSHHVPCAYPPPRVPRGHAGKEQV
eukprot:5366290-Prymnesium_polylepis.1